MDERSTRIAKRLEPVLVMLIGIGTATLLIGAVAEQFISARVQADVAELEAEEEDLIVQVNEISARLDRLQESLRRKGLAS